MTLSKEINEIQGQIAGNASNMIELATRAGELLIEAKAQAKANRKKWLPWVEENLVLKQAQANRYMQLATGKRFLNSYPTRNFETIDKAAAYIGKAKRAEKAGITIEEMEKRKTKTAQRDKIVPDTATKKELKTLPEPTTEDMAAAIRCIADQAPKGFIDKFAPEKGVLPSPSFVMLVKTFNLYHSDLNKLTKADAKKVLAVVSKITGIQSLIFDMEFHARVGARLKERELACAKKEKEIRARERAVAKGKIIYSDEAFSPTEIRTLRSALHTDRTPSQAVRLKAMQILNEKLN